MGKVKCVICGDYFKSADAIPGIVVGNNPDPISLVGRCCDKCNNKFVIPERIRRLNKGLPARMADEVLA